MLFLGLSGEQKVEKTQIFYRYDTQKGHHEVFLEVKKNEDGEVNDD
mgnify:CR=1 FL=1